MTKRQRDIMFRVLARKNEKNPIISLSVIDQPLVDDLSRIIIELSSIMDERIPMEDKAVNGWLFLLRMKD
jgi:hypothetical protein